MDWLPMPLVPFAFVLAALCGFTYGACVFALTAWRSISFTPSVGTHNNEEVGSRTADGVNVMDRR